MAKGDTKWLLAEGLCREGWDMMTALEIADKAVCDFLKSGEQEREVHGRTFSFWMRLEGITP